MPLFESALRNALAKHGVAPGCPLAKAPICTSPTQIGCALSWRTYYEGGDPSQFLQLAPPLPKEWCEKNGTAVFATPVLILKTDRLPR